MLACARRPLACCGAQAGRDGWRAECILFANLTRVPSLLPNPLRTAPRVDACQRMLLALYDYACAGSGCRQRALVSYFGQQQHASWRCGCCDLCTLPSTRPPAAEAANLGGGSCASPLVDVSGEMRLLLSAVAQMVQRIAAGPPACDELTRLAEVGTLANTLAGRAR